MSMFVNVKVVYDYTLELPSDIDEESLIQRVRDSVGMVVCEPKITFEDSVSKETTTLE